ncbi:MAG: hypothetical protein AAGG48_31050 [Planctomycetota bacterium]
MNRSTFESQPTMPRNRRNRLLVCALIVVALGAVAYLLPSSFWGIVIPDVNVYHIE